MLSSLHAMAAPGPFGVEVGVLQLLFKMDPTARLLTAALQRALDTGLEPKLLSTLLTALPKSGRSTVAAHNLCPILVVNTWYRLIMRVFVARLRVGIKNVLSPEQHGFCPDCSAMTGVATLLPVLEQASRSPCGCHVLFLDIAKAYDSVDQAVMD